MAFTLVLRDSFGDVYATRVEGEASQERIDREAHEFADQLGFERGERFRVGLGQSRDVGAARLRGDVPFEDGGTEWLYYLRVGEAEGTGRLLENFPNPMRFR